MYAANPVVFIRARGVADKQGSPRLAAALALLTVLALGARSASAVEYCVGDTTELQAALNDSVNDTQLLASTVIKLQQGTYHVGGTSLATPGQNTFFDALELQGGYNSDCTVRTLNPQNTIFDADGASILSFRPQADLLIEGVRFQNLSGHRLVFIGSAGSDITVSFRNNSLIDAASTIRPDQDSGGSAVSGLSVRYINNRVTGFPGSAEAFQIPAAFLNLASLRFTGNTVADNAGLNAVYVCNSSDVALLDNIGWNNAGDDFRVVVDCFGAESPGDAQFRNNLYQGITMNFVGDSGSNIANTDPLFINAATGNYRLQTAGTPSPAINAGFVTSSQAGVDLDGSARVVGSTVDIGAYESGYDDTVAATLTVTNANDSGAGSLRQAILDANANPDFTFINFNIPGTCPIEIAPDTADLPSITHGVRIDGFSQPGSAANTNVKGDDATRCIILSGKFGLKYGFNFTGGASDQFWVQGLAFSFFSPASSPGNGAAVRLANGKDSIIWGNQFGGTMKTPMGTLALSASDTNILLTNLSNSTSVGGSAPAQRNVIAGAKADGVLVTSLSAGMFTFSSINNDIVGNLIGSDRTESSVAGNHVGVHVKTGGNSVRGNVIINSGQDGVLLEGTSASGNVIEANRIGTTDLFCNVLLCFELAAANGRDGILLSFGPSDNVVYQNRIHSNTARGVEIGSSNGAVSARNWLIANSLYNNGGQGTLFNAYNGADNDADPGAADMANRGLNFPVITRAYGGTKKGVVEGTLSSINGSYVIDVFSSAQADSGYPRGEGDLFHRSYYSVTIDNAAAGQNGSHAFSIPFTSTLSLASRVITLTAADSADGNTSELSAPITYLCDVIFASGLDDATGDKCP